MQECLIGFFERVTFVVERVGEIRRRHNTDRAAIRPSERTANDVSNIANAGNQHQAGTEKA